MARIDSLRMRAGQIFCACDIDGLPLDLDALPKESSLFRMALAFGASVFAQVLTLSVLPLASASFGLASGALPWPYMALLLGAALAAFPASILLDRLGRQTAFALGASLGLAGGLLAAVALFERLYPVFIVGLLWLGMAQGFSLFYRHAGAMAGHAAGLIFAAGLSGAFAAPFMIEFITEQAGPLSSPSLFALAGLANLVTLAVAIGLPGRHIEITAQSDLIKRPPTVSVISATIIAGLAWLVMTGVMAHAPLAMNGCGLSFSMSAIGMAVHLSAMYLPGFTIGRMVMHFGASMTALIGLILLLMGSASVLYQATLLGFVISLAVAGYGWGMATIGATAALHRSGHPSASVLALHDIILFLSALAGAAAFGRL